MGNNTAGKRSFHKSMVELLSLLSFYLSGQIVTYQIQKTALNLGATSAIKQSVFFASNQLDVVRMFAPLFLTDETTLLSKKAAQRLPNIFSIAQRTPSCKSAFYLIFAPFSYETSHLEKRENRMYYEDTKKE